MNQELLSPEKPLAVYDPYRAKVAALKAENAVLVYDYTSKPGQAGARTHMHKLRLSKKPIKDAHDRAKASSLIYIRKLDGELNEIIADIDAMIEVHAKPIAEIDAREEERIEGHLKILTYIGEFQADPGMASVEIAALCGRLSAVVVDESLEEFRDAAAIAYAERSTHLQAAHAAAVKRETEEVELAALRIEKAARDRQDRESQIAKDAADQARSDAAATASRDLEVAEAREKAERARAERAEAETAAAIESAATAQREAEKAKDRAIFDTETRLRLESEKRERDAVIEQQRREADVEHRRVVNCEVLADLIQHAGTTEATGKLIVAALLSGRVRHLRLIY